MSKIDEYAINVKILIMTVFIILSIVAYLMLSPSSCSRSKQQNSVIAFWPPDLAPHPPHFPEPNKPINPAKVSV